MAISPRTVVYQESTNNYTETRQQIKGAQIASVKVFGTAPTPGSGDYQGQFGIANPTANVTNLYTYTSTGWELVGSNQTMNLPDTVVKEDIDNNFTHGNQRILDCPIMYVDEGPVAPAGVPIKGPGHLYVHQVNPIKVYFSADGMDWIGIRTHDDTGDYVVKDKPNDFTDIHQTIEGRPIVAVVQNSLDPVVAGVNPTRAGELYIQLPDGTLDQKARMWISNADGGLHWDPLTHIEFPTMARTDAVNDFQPWEQKISGKQILSFVDGGDLTPEQSRLPADYNGQFYIAVRTMSGGGKSVGIWVAKDGTWLPILEDSQDATIVRTNKTNIFDNPIQYLGSGGNAKVITGAKIKNGGGAPIADSTYKASMEGEICIYDNGAGETSVWMAVTADPTATSINMWKMIWSSKSPDLLDYASLTKSNHFKKDQFISDGVESHLISVAREGKTYEPVGNVAPMSAGEVFVQNVGSGKLHPIWMSYAAGDSNSWRRLVTDNDDSVAQTGEPNTFLSNEQFVHGPGAKKDRIMGAKMAIPTGATDGYTGPPNNIVPTMFGEVLMCVEYSVLGDSNSPLDVVVYIACGVSRDNWIEIGRKKKDVMAVGDPSNPQ